MSDTLARWFLITFIVYAAVHVAVFILRLNGVAIGGVEYAK